MTGVSFIEIWNPRICCITMECSRLLTLDCQKSTLLTRIKQIMYRLDGIEHLRSCWDKRSTTLQLMCSPLDASLPNYLQASRCFQDHQNQTCSIDCPNWQAVCPSLGDRASMSLRVSDWQTWQALSLSHHMIRLSPTCKKFFHKPNQKLLIWSRKWSLGIQKIDRNVPNAYNIHFSRNLVNKRIVLNRRIKVKTREQNYDTKMLHNSVRLMIRQNSKAFTRLIMTRMPPNQYACRNKLTAKCSSKMRQIPINRPIRIQSEIRLKVSTNTLKTYKICP